MLSVIIAFINFYIGNNTSAWIYSNIQISVPNQTSFVSWMRGKPRAGSASNQVKEFNSIEITNSSAYCVMQLNITILKNLSDLPWFVYFLKKQFKPLSLKYPNSGSSSGGYNPDLPLESFFTQQNQVKSHSLCLIDLICYNIFFSH